MKVGALDVDGKGLGPDVGDPGGKLLGFADDGEGLGWKLGRAELDGFSVGT